MKRKVLSFLGIMKEGDTHADAGWNSNTPRSQRLFNFLTVVSLCTFGTGNGLPWYGLVPSFNSKEKQAQYSNHLVFRQKIPQTLWVTPVTYFGLKDLGEYSWR